MGKKMRSIIKGILPELSGLSTFIIIWYLAARNYSAIVLPSPMENFSAFRYLLITNRLFTAVWASIFHIFTGLTIPQVANCFDVNY